MAIKWTTSGLMFLAFALPMTKTYELVRHIDILKECTSQKKEVFLRTGVITFTLNITEPLKEDLDCHFELENIDTRSGGINRDYGRGYKYHIYFDEMNLLKNDAINVCQDYVQFGRDNNFITTKTSEKYCGVFDKVSVIILHIICNWLALNLIGTYFFFRSQFSLPTILCQQTHIPEDT